jgi:hypothetical protein
MIFPNTKTKKEIENYLSEILPQLSKEEKAHFDTLYAKHPQNNTFERILSIIITVEEESVPSGQEVGDFAQGLIDLSPPDIQGLYREFVKEERLDAKLRKTFKDFETQVDLMFP